jgi:hypothetical protein
MPKLPWEHHEDLTLDRLQLVAKILRDTRDKTLLLHDPGGGDTPWTLGCRSYGRCAEMLSRAAGSTCPWMRVISPNLEFVFTIGAVPVRFFRGDSSNPDGPHLRVSDVEAYQYGLAFGDNAVDLRWRIVVETNALGETRRIVLIGSTDAGAVECSYVIPPLSDVTFIEPGREHARPPRQLPAPVVQLRDKKKTKKGDDEGDV